jgi:hypothetical protein
MYVDRNLSMFQTCALPPSSGSKNKLSENPSSTKVRSAWLTFRP